MKRYLALFSPLLSLRVSTRRVPRPPKSNFPFLRSSGERPLRSDGGHERLPGYGPTRQEGALRRLFRRRLLASALDFLASAAVYFLLLSMDVARMRDLASASPASNRCRHSSTGSVLAVTSVIVFLSPRIGILCASTRMVWRLRRSPLARDKLKMLALGIVLAACS